VVTEAVMSLVTAVIKAIFSFVTVPAPPDFLGSAPGWMTTLGGFFADTGAWIPWTLMAAVVATWVLAMAAMVAIKGVRIVASFLTFGGGN